MFARATLVWLLMALLEILQGYLRVRYLNRWLGDRRARLAREFDPRQGGWLGLGMLATLLAPLLAGWWRGWW